MAKAKLFDAIRGYESDLIIDEYNSWKNDTSSNKLRDTSITLMAIFDADKNYNPRKYFWICRISFFAGLMIVPSFMAGVMADTPPKISNLGIRDSNLALNTTYVKAYRLRAHTKKAEACLRGVCWPQYK